MSTAVRARRHELDHLRVLATLGVIALHTGAAVVVAWRDSRPELISAFNVGNVGDAGGRFAVNCFFMTSGALLLDPVRRFVLRPQFLRVAIPTVAWIVGYALANVIFTAHGIPGVGGALKNVSSLSPTEIVRSLLAGPAVYHLWFVYALLGVYLIVPVLRAVTDRPEPERLRLLRLLLVLWVVAGLLPLWSRLLLDERAPTIYGLPLEPLPTGYVGIFLLGFVLSHYRDRIRVPSATWAVLATAGFLWTFTTVWLAARAGDEDTFAGYHNFGPPVLLFSISVFAFFAGRDRGPGPIWPFVLRFSELSFRVYLVHVLVLHTLRFTTGLGDLAVERPVVGMPVLYVLTVAISLLVAWLLDLVPPLRRWI